MEGAMDVVVDRTGWSPERGVDGGHATEADAARIAVEGTAFEKARLAGRALGRLLRDPDDTVQVLLLGLALNAPRLPQLVTRFVLAPGGLAMLHERPTIDSRTVDFGAMRCMPGSTLGGAYARYLDDNHLDPDLFQPPPGLPEVPRFLAQRIRQTHDVWHVLTGYAPDVPGELALQGFTFAQLGMPSSFLIATLGTLVRAPREAARVWDGYARGRDAAFLPPVRFEAMWARPLEEVRRELRLRPAVGAA
jgi:ubiquinone biosynthesis protein COQ4